MDVNLGTNAGVLVNDEVLFFSNAYFNGLFKYEIKSGSMSIISHFDNIPICQEQLHSSALRYHNDIVFVPSSDDYLRIFDTDTYVIQSYRIPDEYRSISYYNGNVVNDKLYFVSFDYKLIAFDLNTREFERYCKLENLLQDVIQETSAGEASISVQDSLLYVSNVGFSGFYEIDVKSAEKTKWIMKDGFERINFITKFDNSFWILCFDREDVICWDKKEGYSIYNCDDIEWTKCYKKNFLPFGKVFQGNRIVISGYYSIYPYMVNKMTGRIERFFHLDSNFGIVNAFEFGACLD